MPAHRVSNHTRKARGTLRPSTAHAKPVQGHGEIGPPPSRLNPKEADAWQEIVEQIPPKVLTRCDRATVEHLARLTALIWRNDASSSQHALAARLRHDLGMTPAGRVALGASAEDKPDWNAFDDLGPRVNETREQWEQRKQAAIIAGIIG